MPVEHRSFWKELPVSKEAKDLLQEDDFETAGFDEWYCFQCVIKISFDKLYN